MSDSCNQNCDSCSVDCDTRKTSFIEKLNDKSNVKKVIGIVSGKGGVGKSLVTALIAIEMQRRGNKVAIMDSDITGPSIPKMFGITQKARGNEDGILPVKTRTGIDVMSLNLLLEDETDPVVWRGPIIGGTVKQFWTEVIWEDEDYMFIDMPPGTGDIALTVFQSIPVDGIIVVTSPQELVSMIVTKALKMAKMMNIPIIGLVENMSYFKCPDNDKEYKIFGESHIDEIAEEFNLKVLAKLPIDPEIAQRCDRGEIETIGFNFLDSLANEIQK